MKLKLILNILCLMCLMLGFEETGRADEAKWACIKDGSEVKVSGDVAADKKKDCEKQAGKWSQQKKDDSSAKKQESGSGGGW